ncbi:E3 ubiquitin-protein ligase TRIM33-like [Mercenaria mercenaria]|uniref:E3 ubiquitin-protein ligase TRIM33-like n=1 Tax=Mercenaria mercenaria TaxID=6596 RepID=UPI00234F2A0E|nr:E3 ubiquitin-protein ligase TRIM33-like [Mercenaria mercenaria]XP_053408851.1 E3 ubiquitin-protein ligase TRIM33-like [Mercenaria mercenaria]XP_053408852.1 E3 ubiquitin-protein ligase TRIM33-like [Mercenaria mercenaria]
MASTARSQKSKKSTIITEVEFPCGPCKNDNRNVEALGFCKFCKHYLCKSCYSYHQNLGKIHILIGRDAMPRETPTPVSAADPLIESCRQHKHKTIELYCKNHDEVCCVICATSKHKSCECFYIPQYTEQLTQSPNEDCSLILKLIKALIGQFENVRSESATRLKDLDRQKREFSMAVRKYRKEIDFALEQLEKQVISGMKQVVDINTKELNDNINKCDEALKELNETVTDAEMAVESSGTNRIFTLSKISNKLLQENNAVLKTVRSNSVNVEIKYEENAEILRNVRRTKTFGKVSVKKEPVKFETETQQKDEGNENKRKKSAKSTDSS